MFVPIRDILNTDQRTEEYPQGPMDEHEDKMKDLRSAPSL